MNRMTQDRETGARYYYSDQTGMPVDRTVSFADEVMVDLDADGLVIGVELAMDCRGIGMPVEDLVAFAVAHYPNEVEAALIARKTFGP